MKILLLHIQCPEFAVHKIKFYKVFLRSSAAHCWNFIGFLKAFLDNTSKSIYAKHFSCLNDPIGPAT
jgi:hypothetical protein